MKSSCVAAAMLLLVAEVSHDSIGRGDQPIPTEKSIVKDAQIRNPVPAGGELLSERDILKNQLVMAMRGQSQRVPEQQNLSFAKTAPTLPTRHSGWGSIRGLHSRSAFECDVSSADVQWIQRNGLCCDAR
jgi:hypothetical protein